MAKLGTSKSQHLMRQGSSSLVRVPIAHVSAAGAPHGRLSLSRRSNRVKEKRLFFSNKRKKKKKKNGFTFYF